MIINIISNFSAHNFHLSYTPKVLFDMTLFQHKLLQTETNYAHGSKGLFAPTFRSVNIGFLSISDLKKLLFNPFKITCLLVKSKHYPNYILTVERDTWFMY